MIAIAGGIILAWFLIGLFQNAGTIKDIIDLNTLYNKARAEADKTRQNQKGNSNENARTQSVVDSYTSSKSV